MNNLDKYRNDKDRWVDVSYVAQRSEDRGEHDANEKQRYLALLELQYDHADEDEEFVRYLFEQEVIARENDSFQGIGEALWLGAYLLAIYQSVNDIPLFYRAKFANFDTGCGFDREFIYVALRNKTEEYVADRYPELYEEIEGGYESLDLMNRFDEWWKGVVSRYPSSESEEDFYGLFERYVNLEKVDVAKIYLDKWITIEPESGTKNSRLKYAYVALGDYQRAIDVVKEELSTKESHWDKVSVNHTLLELYSKISAPKEGLMVIESINREFEQFDDWIDIGLGRMVIHAAFEYSLSVNSDEVARAVFNHGYNWFKKMDSIAYIGLEAGWKAAERCGNKIKAKKLKYLANREKQRIENI